MSRISDTERGARLAADDALLRLLQPDLFPASSASADLVFWQLIHTAAVFQLDDCRALREALRG